MPTTLKSPQRAIQLTLFYRARKEPAWEALPIEIQQQVLRLLARMLRERVARRGDEAMSSEACDE